MLVEELNYDVLQMIRENKTKMKDFIQSYLNKECIIFVEVQLDCDLNIDNVLEREYLWATLEKFDGEKIWVRFIQYSEKISYINEFDFFDFELNDITNLSIDAL